jgi:hypothetical protein
MHPSMTVPTRVIHHNRGYGYGVAGKSGTIGAALAIDSLVFAMLCDPQAGEPVASKRTNVYVDRLELAFTTIAAFTVPVVAGRGLGVYRAAGVAATGGTALAVAKKDTNAPASIVTDVRISAAAALGVAGIVREAAPIGFMPLTHVGAAGGHATFLFELAAPMNVDQALQPGELLVVSNPVAMDAGGTWQLTVKECHWYEAKGSA